MNTHLGVSQQGDIRPRFSLSLSLPPLPAWKNQIILEPPKTTTQTIAQQRKTNTNQQQQNKQQRQQNHMFCIVLVN